MANVSYSSCHLFLVIYERGDLPDTYKMDRYTYSSWFSIYKPRATPYVLIMSFSFLQKCTQWIKIEKNIIEYNFELSFLIKNVYFSQQRNRTETSFALLHIWMNLFYGTCVVIKDMMEHILCPYLCIQSCHQQKPMIYHLSPLFWCSSSQSGTAIWKPGK